MTLEETRQSLVQLAGALLVGPLVADEVLQSAPADTYLTGILWPQDAPVDGVDDDGELGGQGDAEAGEESAVPGYRAIRPCSIGLTFAVEKGATVLVTLGDTARYEPLDANPSDSARREGAPAADEDNAGLASESSTSSSRREWKRLPVGYKIELPPAAASGVRRLSRFQRINDGTEVEDSRLSLHVKCRVGSVQDMYTVTLINEQLDERGAGGRDARCLFQAELVITAEIEGRGGIRPRPAVDIEEADDDARSNALLYRDVNEFAVGHGVAADWAPSNGDHVEQVRTAWLPLRQVPGTTSTGHSMLVDFRTKWPDALTARFLSDEARRGPVTDSLMAFADCYRQWIKETLEPRLSNFQPPLAAAAQSNLDRCLSTADRIEDGVEFLRRNDDAWAAFTLANSAMDRQATYPAKGKNIPPLIWRPFQLAYVLLVLPGLTDPELDDREFMDLLWFPTGGGKTEAYLALTAYQIFLRRLTDTQRREQGGVDVLMRYTLRLLTVQQFQRAAALISACDAIRREDARLGAATISIGLYVGKEATPNSMKDALKALEEERARQNPRSTPRQLLRCPVCGSDLAATAYRPHATHAQIDIVCEAKECATGGHPLPVLTVDEVIYAKPPSLLIGTVDKFAQIPRRGDLRSIFGLDGGLPPGLIIQDELHLISGPLGSMAGLYEAAIDLLCSRGPVRPKIIGSTATIGRAESQVRALFDRSVLQFPPPGFDAGDSFFAVRDSVGPDRLYVGISTAGRSPKFALQALVAALSQSIAALTEREHLDDAVRDAYWTCVCYFNSLRELGGADVLVQDDVPRQMRFLAGRLGVARRDFREPPMELSSRRSSRELPQLLQQVSTTLAQFLADPFQYAPPPDNVLASNMISVGVDVPRLGLMVVNGQPKSTAEYIQASSRVGRGIPGLVFTLYNFGRPRDVSHFEHFQPYHDALYRNVEATSVTPWAPRARDKALHAAVISAVRHLVPGMSDDDDAIRFHADDPSVVALLGSIAQRVRHAVGDAEGEETEEDIRAIVSEWARRSHEARTTGTRLRYWERRAPFGKTAPHLMSSAEDGGRAGTLSWSTPNTMREVEPSSAFVLKTISRKKEVPSGDIQ